MSDGAITLYTVFLHTINEAIRKITEHLPKLKPDRMISFQDIPLQCLFGTESTCHHKVARLHTPITENRVPSSQKVGIASSKEGGRMWDSSVPALKLPHLYLSSSLLCWMQG